MNNEADFIFSWIGVAILAFVIALVISLSACGGGGSSTPPDAHDKAVYPVPIIALRPCETTGPTAPPCPSTAQAVAH
jgi:hypothetical protein